MNMRLIWLHAKAPVRVRLSRSAKIRAKYDRYVASLPLHRQYEETVALLRWFLGGAA